MEATIKTRVEELITCYIAACGGVGPSWIAYNPPASEQVGRFELARTTFFETLYPVAYGQEEEIERISALLVRALLVKSRRCADPNGKSRIARIGVTRDGVYVTLTVFMSGVRNDEQLMDEIVYAYQRLGNSFEPLDNRPRLALDTDN